MEARVGEVVNLDNKVIVKFFRGVLHPHVSWKAFLDSVMEKGRGQIVKRKHLGRKNKGRRIYQER